MNPDVTGVRRAPFRGKRKGRKDPHRSPMALRWQAAFRAIQNEARLEAFNHRKAKREAVKAQRAS